MSFAVGLAILYIIAKLLTLPLKIILRLLVNGLIGGVLLLILNFIGSFFGFALDITPLSALVAGVFGLPAVIVLILIQVL